MRAIVVDQFGPPEALRAREAATPSPGPGEVVVETYAAPVNYVDMLVVAGTYQFLPQLPFIPGKGPAGIVSALGPGVTTLRVGDRVLAMAATGADAIIDLSRADLRDSLREQVYAETGGRGADIIIDPLGGEIFTAAIRALAWCGRLVVIGFAAGGIPTLKTNYLLLKNIEVSGLQITDYRYRRPAELKACYAELFGFYDSGHVKPASATMFPLDRAGE